MMDIRKPAVAGQFYSQSEAILKRELKELFAEGGCEDEELIEAKGVVMPHAGYIYSGSVAAKAISKAKPTNTYIIIGPNHTGHGKPFSLMDEGVWQTPLGDVEIESELSKKLLNSSKFLERDNEAHIYEHSIEVELPLLQYRQEGFKIVPIILTSAKLEVYLQIAKEIAGCIKDAPYSVTIIASSDFTHFEDHDTASKKDKMAIDAILELDEEKFLNIVTEHEISVCGYAPICVMLASAKLLGAKEAKLVEYKTSGDTSGDYESVVGYAGILVS